MSDRRHGDGEETRGRWPRTSVPVPSISQARRPAPSRVEGLAATENGDASARLALTRRQLLKAVAGAAVMWQAAPWPLRAPAAFAQTPPTDPFMIPTLEAFADTLIPGEKRSPADRAIAGAAPGAGAVQAGAIDLMFFQPAGVAPGMPAFAAGLNARATAFAAMQTIILDPTVPPLVSLNFAQRTAFLVELLDGTDPDQLAWFALAALVFLAYHTAGHLPTADAVRNGHPGLAAIKFPLPQADGFWRFPDFSYRKVLARRYRKTRHGSPP
jgi:enediyne biosynthesis protein E8